MIADGRATKLDALTSSSQGKLREFRGRISSRGQAFSQALGTDDLNTAPIQAIIDFVDSRVHARRISGRRVLVPARRNTAGIGLPDGAITLRKLQILYWLRSHHPPPSRRCTADWRRGFWILSGRDKNMTKRLSTAPFFAGR